MAAASDLTAALNSGNYTAAANAMASLTVSGLVPTGAVEAQDLSVGAVQAASAPAIGVAVFTGAV